MIFGGTATVDRYRGNPKVQAHGPGFSKILLGDDVVDRCDYLDLMVESIYLNSGRGCINCSGVWASRHTREIADALAERLGPIEALPPTDPKAGLAAFTVQEYMCPFAAVVACPQAEMLKRIGPTLVGTVITNDESLRQAATNATNIDRLNLGPVPTTKLNWLQPHEGNLIDFLFRNRALQISA
jgi:hypothetical protein